MTSRVVGDKEQEDAVDNPGLGAGPTEGRAVRVGRGGLWGQSTDSHP
jgi:hypothetical protein